MILGLLGYALLLHLLDRADARRPLRSAFFRAWLTGTVFFVVSTWWIGEAFMVEPEIHGWQAPFAVGGLSAGLGLLWGGAGLAYRALAPQPGTLWAGRRVLVFAAVFGLAEWLRGHILTGFPWDLPGETWRAGSAMSQGAALVGAYGLSVVTLAIAAAPALLFGDAPRPARLAPVAMSAAVLVGLLAWGSIRLARSESTSPRAPLVRIVQPNIPQAAKWDASAFRDIVLRYVRLTAMPSRRGRVPDVVVWPESAIPADVADYLALGSWTRPVITHALRPGQMLITGAQRSEVDGGAMLYFNSLVVLRREGENLRTLASYDKHHLVPFGEYLPFSRLLTGIGFRALAQIPADFTPGGSPRPIAPEGLPPMQPLICYETLFPGYVTGAGPRPSWIVNVSNDAWFGKISGPWQHLNIASYRAIEQGLPIIRSTPTGVSAAIDSYGRSLAQLPPSAQGVIDVSLPAPLDPTPYSRLQDGPFWAMILMGLGCAVRKPRSLSGAQG